MRWCAGIALTVAAAGLGSYIWNYPPAPAIEVSNQPAQLVSELRWSGDRDWFGGFSGIEVSDDGRWFHAVTDKGHLVSGRLERDPDEVLISALVDSERLLTNAVGRGLEMPGSDSEGLAVDKDGRLYVSFERNARVLRYDTPDSSAQREGYTSAWRALSKNGALELLAIDEDGTLFTIPEQSGDEAKESLVYRKRTGEAWNQPFMYPLEGRYLPVGGDFGPDGRLYILERDFYIPGFRSRVRSFDVTPRGFTHERLVLESKLGDFGNLEGLAVWRDRTGQIRLTIVADDNFMPFQRSQIVEFVLTE